MGNYIDDKGNTVEAFSPEEVEEKLNEVREQTKEEIGSAKQEEIDDLNVQISDKEESLKMAKEDLEKEKSKDKNLSGQRGIIQAKEKEIEEIKKGMEELKKTTEEKLSSLERKEKDNMVVGMIAELAGTNKEMTEKVKFYYDNFKPIDETGKKKEDIEKEISTRVQNAYLLAVGTMPRVQFSGPIISGAGGTPMINPTGEKLSPELHDLAGKMGINQDELKKHKLI
jgi:chromosome segregation ATPase